MISLLATLFICASLALIFPHALYPPVLFILSRLCRSQSPGAATPSVTLIISAHNEATVIRDKLENALKQSYPRELLEIMVISDASDDGTDTIVREYSAQNVRLYRQDERQGKSAGLTRFCPEANGDILVFTDANAMFRPDAIKHLVSHFDDPQIGYTVGCQLYENTDGHASADSENLYWSLELQLKRWESRLSSVVGADGAIYALRKELFEPLSPEDINDFLLPLKVVANGHRGIFESNAVCFEEAAPDFRGEFRRKYRIVNRSLRAVTKVPQALNPLRVGWFAFQLASHKVLRWLGPISLTVMFVTSAVLAAMEATADSGPGLFSVMLALQITGYAVATLYLLPPLRKLKVVYIAYYFFLVNVAAAVGIGILLSGRTIGVWKPQR